MRVESCLSEKNIPNILKHLKFILVLIMSYMTTTQEPMYNCGKHTVLYYGLRGSYYYTSHSMSSPLWKLWEQY